MTRARNDQPDETPNSVSRFATQRDVREDDAPSTSRRVLTTRRAVIGALGTLAVLRCLPRRHAVAADSPPGHRELVAPTPPPAARPDPSVAPVIPWPRRPSDALPATELARRLMDVGGKERDAIILSELRSGNVPGFLRRFVPVHRRSADGAMSAIVYVLPDYLAIGSDDDFLRVPMMPSTAQRIADELECVLPTRAIVDAVHQSAVTKLDPIPLDAGPEMVTTEDFVRHNDAIEEQRRARGGVLGTLIAGQKKDVVISARLETHPHRVAIYGFHRRDGTPIQSLSTLHPSYYVDYAHGIRLVADVVWIDGEQRRASEVLTDPHLAAALSDEGKFASSRYT